MKILAFLGKRTRRMAAVTSLLVLLVSSATGAAAAGSAYSYDPSLVAYWTFDDGSGTTASDASDNGRTGTLKNGAPSPTPRSPRLNLPIPLR